MNKMYFYGLFFLRSKRQKTPSNPQNASDSRLDNETVVKKLNVFLIINSLLKIQNSLMRYKKKP